MEVLPAKNEILSDIEFDKVQEEILSVYVFWDDDVNELALCNSCGNSGCGGCGGCGSNA